MMITELLIDPTTLSSTTTSTGTMPVAGTGPAPGSLTTAIGKHRKLLQGSVTGLLTSARTAAKDAATSAVTAVTSAAGAAANTTAAAARVADKNTHLPIEVSVQSAGVVPLKALAGISSGAFAQLLGMLPGTAATPLKQFVGTERLE
jgi:hypothetical protein